MPHLSPMNWLIVPLFMVFTLLTLMVIMWWQFMPQFPLIFSSQATSSVKMWRWW